MNHRNPSPMIQIVLVLALTLLAGCGSESDPVPAGNAGAPAGGTSAVPGGSGGMALAGTSGMTSAGSSAAGTSAMNGAVPATFETVKLVFGGGGGVMPCSAAPCHGVNGVAPPDRPLELPPMNDAQLYTNLTTYMSRACGEIKLVTPGNADQSALVRILQGPCGKTPRMPYGCSAEAGDCIPDEYIAAVAQWIANGAPRP